MTLTDDEAAALREVLAGLAVIGERGFDDDKQLCQITAQTWREMLLRPAQRLHRVTTPRLVAAEDHHNVVVHRNDAARWDWRRG